VVGVGAVGLKETVTRAVFVPVFAYDFITEAAVPVRPSLPCHAYVKGPS
jgi:hypothetical protein